MNDFNTIPTLDMDLYHSRDPQTQSQFCKMLCDICHNVGFFYLTNHRINPELIKNVLHNAKLFFDLPQADKDQIDISLSPHYRGYGKLNAETTHGIADYKETYDIGLESKTANSHKNEYLKLHGPNQWPAALQPQFQQVMLQYIHAMMQLGNQLMVAAASGLNLNTKQVTDIFNINSADAYAMLRLLHYPPAKSTNTLGVGPHVDAGFLVFLLQDETGGLQVQNHKQQWIDAPPRENTFIVNIGEMLQLMTNNYFQATPHRVINNSEKYRISAPFFFEPNLSAEITPLSLSNQSHNKIIYGEYMLNIFKRSFRY